MAWYDNNWDYRKKVTLTETSGSTLSNYSVHLNISFVSGHMNSDFSDLRFTSSDGTTLLDYWIESYTASTSANIWIKVPTITASTTTNIYMYYGNSGASTTSNIKTTFVIGDDFNDGSIDTSIWVQDSEANFLGGNASQTESGGLFYTQYGGIWSNLNTIGDGHAWKARLKWQGTFRTGTYVGVGFGVPNSNNNYTGTYATRNLFVLADDNLTQKPMYNNTVKGTLAGASSGTFYDFEGKSSGGYAQITFNGTSWTQASGVAMSGSNRFGVYSEHWSGSPTSYIDYCFVRKYTSSEPTYSIGSEESSGPDFTKFQINISDSWKQCAGMKINIGDSWKEVSSAKINIGDSWKTII